MKRTQRQDHRLVIDAGASEFPGGKHADRPFLTTNLIQYRYNATLRDQVPHLHALFPRITAGNGKVAERASPRWLAFSITTQRKCCHHRCQLSIATQKSASGSKRRAFATRFRAPARVSLTAKRVVPVHRSRRQRMQYGRIPSPKIS
ncbi:TrpR gene coding for the trp operon repressor protein [Escherichia coli]|uniref:TrpR gene coding for the trp operon repressor protein n=1 Tax=Escherichia coli TaxID=562 RepID=A0A376RRE1_ECOLX|nr:TrpR gene coding for the trp operon repressor protein [Escherichia coli]